MTPPAWLGWALRRHRFGRPVTDLRAVAAHARGLLPAEPVAPCHCAAWRRAMDQVDADLVGSASIDPLVADARRQIAAIDAAAAAQQHLADLHRRASFAALVSLGGAISPTTPIRSRRGRMARVIDTLL